jgi:hypothetical protein
MRILAWNSPWLRMLRALPHEFIVVDPENARGMRRQRFDCILFQEEHEYLDWQYELLTPAQRRAPKVYVEYEPPRKHPVDSRHVVTDEEVLVVHVSAYNRLMWDHGRSPVRLIEPGVADSGSLYHGERARGMALPAVAGRRAGSDLLDHACSRLPIDILPQIDPTYRYAFHPARQCALRLELIEAMMGGMPLVGLATGDLPMLLRDGESGFLDHDLDRLMERMRELLADRALAARLGAEARRIALERFSIERFLAQWSSVLTEAAGALRTAA